MKVYFYLDEDKIYENSTNDGAIPRAGDLIYLDEVFFVESVVWYPKTNDTVRINLTETDPNNKPVAESRQPVLNSKELKEASTKATNALKEVALIKDQLISIRQHIKRLPQQKAKPNDDSR